jgi:hypothetical protein
MDDVSIVRDAKGVYTIRAHGTAPLSKPDIMDVHMDPDGARFFRDVGKYDRCNIDKNGVMKAEWKVDSKRIVLIKSPTPEGIEFWTGEGSDIHMEGTWAFDTDGPRTTRVALSQSMALAIPPFVPGFIVRGILKQKIRRAFEDIAKINRTVTV